VLRCLPIYVRYHLALQQFVCNREQNWLTTSQTHAEWEPREHVVFHLHNDYATQQEQHFRVQKRVADSQNSGAIPNRLKRLFLQLFMHSGERL
jgi:hypothetical protein